MRFAIAQIQCIPGEVALNTRTMTQHIRNASEAGCETVAFPEMCDTGYHLPTIIKTASDWEHGPLPELSAAAAEGRINVIAGLSERVDGQVYNSVAVIGSDGRLIDKYRKIHLATVQPICEEKYLQAGNRPVVCSVGGFRIGLMTCYDIRFPELARRLCLDGAEILVVPAAFPQVRVEHWTLLTACRAIENQVYLAAVNRVGEDFGMVFGGESRIWDPTGIAKATSGRTEESLLITEISRDRINEIRSQVRVFQDRRPDLYG